jgi:hypothetical protein
MLLPTDGHSTKHRVVPGEECTGVLDRSVRLATVIVLILFFSTIFIRDAGPLPKAFVFLAWYLAAHQDLPIAVGTIFFFLFVRFALRRYPTGVWSGLRFVTLRPTSLILIVVAVVIWLARLQLLFDHDLSRDEQMANFDAQIFAQGRLYWPIPESFRPYYQALNALFILPVGDRQGWVSSYLPINAGIRALVSQIAPSSIVSPLLVLVAGLSLWRIARRLWPESIGTQSVVLLCFLSSSQVILMGTTAYAMSAHLAFNLVWLLLFLQRGRTAQAAAILVGFFATGLHQPLFHPLFVLPFLDLLRQERRWRVLGIYCAAYAAIGLFWLAWPAWVSEHGFQATVPSQVNSEGIDYVERLANGLVPPTTASLWIMCANLLRFLTWQHILLLPLFLVGVRTCIARDRVSRALALGILLLIVTMTLILPPQGHGWGYRYMHGFIGSACLLAGYGWRWLEMRGAAPARVMTWATIGSFTILLPVHFLMVRSMIDAPAEISRKINRLNADFAIVEDDSAPFADDLVINRPDLSNRPIRLLASQFDPTEIGGLCRGHVIAFVDAPELNPLNRLYGTRLAKGPGEHQRRLREMAIHAGCRIRAFYTPQMDSNSTSIWALWGRPSLAFDSVNARGQLSKMIQH